MPDVESCLNIHLTIGRTLQGEFVLPRIVDRKLVVDLLIKSASEDQVVVLELVLGVAAYIGLIGVELAVQEDKLLASWEKVALGAHAEPNLRIVVNQRVPWVSDDLTRWPTIARAV